MEPEYRCSGWDKYCKIKWVSDIYPLSLEDIIFDTCEEDENAHGNERKGVTMKILITKAKNKANTSCNFVSLQEIFICVCKNLINLGCL